MKSIRFQYSMKRYRPMVSGYADLDMLGAFLGMDVGTDVENGQPPFKAWIYDDRYENTGSNFSFLEKEGDKIIIGCEHWKNDPYEWIFECTKKQLAHILDRWAELVPLRPKEIIIIYDGETYFVEGRDFPDQSDVK